MPHFVILAGASGSGKTFYARKLLTFIRTYYPHISVSHISMDNYYKRRPPHVKTEDELQQYNEKTNFDTPDSLDFELFHGHLRLLASNKCVERPVYCFEQSDRLPETVKVAPTDLIIVEGIFAHYKLAQSGLGTDDYTPIFVESSFYLNYQQRRIERDPKERKIPVDQILKKELLFIRNAFFNTIKPAANMVDALCITNDYMSGPEDFKEPKDSNYPNGIDEIIAKLNDRCDLDLSSNKSQNIHSSAPR